MADKAAEQIKYEVEVLRFTALVAVGTAGGSVGLLLGKPTPLRLSLAGVGFLLTLGVGLIAWRLDRRIHRLIDVLQEQI